MKLVIIALVVALAVFAGLQSFGRGVAPVPGVFAGAISLDEGLRVSEAEGRPVVAVVTADWCAPCQTLKREALADEAVASWIAENAVAVYVDYDKSPGEAKALGVRALPTTVVIKDGDVVAARTGVAEPASYLAFLRDAVE